MRNETRCWFWLDDHKWSFPFVAPLRTLSEGGMQFLLTAVRANTGVKSGRYMFEARIVELLTCAEPHGARTPQPKHLLRVGFTTEGSSLFLADGTDNVAFDSEGFFTHGKTRSRSGAKVYRDQTVAILLNLEEGPNKNTMSLFVDGVRSSKPMPLPESLCGKVLYPTITYRNISLEVNLGPTPRKPLPFSCHMLAGAAAQDVVVSGKAKAGKKECVFPIGLPDQGKDGWGSDTKHMSDLEFGRRKPLCVFFISLYFHRRFFHCLSISVSSRVLRSKR